MNEVFQVLLPGMIYFWVLFIAQGPMQEILEEKESRTLARILAAPVTLREYLVAKLARCFLLCGLIETLLLVLSAACFDVDWGNPVHMGLVVAVSAFSMTGFLALVYALARTKEQANTLSTTLILAFGMLGGSMFPYESLPRFMQAAGEFTPHRWGILAIQGVARAKPLEQLVMPLLILTVVGLVGTGLGFRLFHRHLHGGTAR